ncbi:hypothetical protein ANCDUO_16233 [Ancylostoma duodenale]|uniref:Uncharacterized protein n=1 Tax=Ancylostoma duodenale TaxID=51022 RepID=A0A0C2CUX8_9BILA|nr:hypothetical protein ANCDUO_16233 [Ancylostoma duodenale]
MMAGLALIAVATRVRCTCVLCAKNNPRSRSSVSIPTAMQRSHRFACEASMLPPCEVKKLVKSSLESVAIGKGPKEVQNAKDFYK